MAIVVIGGECMNVAAQDFMLWRRYQTEVGAAIYNATTPFSSASSIDLGPVLFY
jgi:hypothetical protein